MPRDIADNGKVALDKIQQVEYDWSLWIVIRLKWMAMKQRLFES